MGNRKREGTNGANHWFCWLKNSSMCVVLFSLSFSLWCACVCLSLYIRASFAGCKKQQALVEERQREREKENFLVSGVFLMKNSGF